MPITLIEGKVKRQTIPTKELTKENSIQISEFFADTLQGEGVSAGQVASFMRVTGCTLDCHFCDTSEVWREGDRYSFEEIFEMMDNIRLPQRFRKGQHLILTGGSPLKQQESLVKFLEAFQMRYGFIPYIEVENEAVLMPIPTFQVFVQQWNNSPKLSNSGMKERARYKPLTLAHTAALPNSWFKFVVTCEEDWQEIQMHFIDTDLIRKDQVIVMPEGCNQQELSRTREIAADMAIKHNVRFSDRLHVTVWNQKTGV